MDDRGATTSNGERSANNCSVTEGGHAVCDMCPVCHVLSTWRWARIGLRWSRVKSKWLPGVGLVVWGSISRHAWWQRTGPLETLASRIEACVDFHRQRGKIGVDYWAGGTCACHVARRGHAENGIWGDGAIMRFVTYELIANNGCKFLSSITSSKVNDEQCPNFKEISTKIQVSILFFFIFHKKMFYYEKIVLLR